MRKLVYSEKVNLIWKNLPISLTLLSQKGMSNQIVTFFSNVLTFSGCTGSTIKNWDKVKTWLDLIWQIYQKLMLSGFLSTLKYGINKHACLFNSNVFIYNWIKMYLSWLTSWETIYILLVVLDCAPQVWSYYPGYIFNKTRTKGLRFNIANSQISNLTTWPFINLAI